MTHCLTNLSNYTTTSTDASLNAPHRIKKKIKLNNIHKKSRVEITAPYFTYTIGSHTRPD